MANHESQTSEDHAVGVRGPPPVLRTVLRRNARASLLVLDPIMDPRARDGVRLTVEFLGAEEDGKELGELSRWLESFAPGRRVVRRLIFKIINAENFRPRPSGPVVM